MSAAVWLLVIWLIGSGVGSVIIYMSSALIGYWIAEESGGAVGAVIGWVLAFMWGIFATVQIILQVIAILQLVGS